MENILGLLRVHIRRGVNLAVRDVRSSDPYVIVKMGKQVRKAFKLFWWFLSAILHTCLGCRFLIVIYLGYLVLELLNCGILVLS